MKIIIISSLMFLLSVNSFASKVGEINKKRDLDKMFAKGLSHGFAEKLYFDFEKLMSDYNEKAVAFNKLRKPDYKKISKVSGDLMKKLKLKVMPVF